jgi:hypothetical protein
MPYPSGGPNLGKKKKFSEENELKLELRHAKIRLITFHFPDKIVFVNLYNFSDFNVFME